MRSAKELRRPRNASMRVTASNPSSLPIDCSGDIYSCPDNDGTGCVCAQHRASMHCKNSHPHDAMDYDCELMALVELHAAKARVTKP